MLEYVIENSRLKCDSIATGAEVATTVITAAENSIFVWALELGEHWKHCLNKFQIKKLHQVGNWNEQQKKNRRKLVDKYRKMFFGDRYFYTVRVGHILNRLWKTVSFGFCLIFVFVFDGNVVKCSGRECLLKRCIKTYAKDVSQLRRGNYCWWV